MSPVKFLIKWLFVVTWFFVCANNVSPHRFPLEPPLLQLGKKVSSPAPPKYMVTLYNSLSMKMYIPHETSNTIRSFEPSLGKLGDRTMMVFNLTGIHSSEYIDRAYMHLEWREKMQWRRNRILRLSTLNLNDASDYEIKNFMRHPTVRFSMSGSGWQNVPLTYPVIEGLDTQNGAESQQLLGILPQEEEGGTIRDINMDELYSHYLLLVYTQDDDDLTIEHLQDITRNPTIPNLSHRKRRQVVDNELPDYSEENNQIIKADVQAREKYKPLESITKPDEDDGKQGKQSKKGKRRRIKKRRLQLKWRRSWWKEPKKNSDEGDYLEDELMLKEERKNDSACQRKSLIVDFTKIGWTDWIISPKRFNAHICTGECSFSLAKVNQPSNYAALRSILAEKSKEKSELSRLCCVPNTFSEIPVLFYDKNKNVVLKKFPGMKVESCFCR